MRRATYHRLNRIVHLSVALSLGGSLLWNSLDLSEGLRPGWPALLLPLPALVGWLGLRAYPRLSARIIPAYPHTYRLLYNTPAGWTDEQARQALLTLIRAGTGLDIIWARQGEELACWLAVAHETRVLERLVADLFPQGFLEAAAGPEIGSGVVLLHGQTELPTPVALCRQPGIEGVYYRWRSDQTALVALWGAAAPAVARRWARPEDLWPGQGQTLLKPPFAGDNPWPALPPFPASAHTPGLAAVSDLERVAPPLRILREAPALLIGPDAEQQPLGFAGPDWAGLQPLYITGQATGPVVLNLATQARHQRLPLVLLDGQGGLTGQLARRWLGEMAAGQILLCDVERPGQSRFRLNPLGLPEVDPFPAQVVASGWLAWLQEQGVTAAGLGLTASRTTQAAVLLSAAWAAQQQLSLDLPGLGAVLRTPEFLLQVEAGRWAGAETALWQWWRSEGRRLSRFDLQLGLAHLRDRLGALLDLPEYAVLWRGPYLEPLAALAAGQSLCWRLPDPRQRLGPYLSSQLLALHSLLTAWPPGRPLLIFLHEVEAGAWLARLHRFPQARLIVSSHRPAAEALPVAPTSLLVSRLAAEPPAWLQAMLPGLRASDLRRLPPQRLVLGREQLSATVDLEPAALPGSTYQEGALTSQSAPPAIMKISDEATNRPSDD